MDGQISVIDLSSIILQKKTGIILLRPFCTVKWYQFLAKPVSWADNSKTKNMASEAGIYVAAIGGTDVNG